MTIKGMITETVTLGKRTSYVSITVHKEQCSLYLATKNTCLLMILDQFKLFISMKEKSVRRNIQQHLCYRGKKSFSSSFYTHFINQYSVYYTKVIIIVGLIDQTHFPKMPVNTIIQGIDPFTFFVGHLERKKSRRNISKPTTQRSQMLLA